MSIVVATHCGSCGAVDLGTRFCETCGTEFAASVRQPVARPATAGLSAGTLRVLRTLVAILMGLSTLTPYSFFGLIGLICAALVATLAAIAGFGGWATPTRRVIAGILGILFVATPFALNVHVVGIGLAGALAFASWGLSRPFTGPGWFGLAPIVAGAAISTGISQSYEFLGYSVASIGSVVALVFAFAAAIALPLLVERRAFAQIVAQRREQSLAASAFQPAMTAVPTGGTNTPALLSLIFGLLGSGVVPIVLGHVALSQIRRTGETGRGMAIAGIVLGWVGIAAIVGVFVIYGLVFAGLSSLNY